MITTHESRYPHFWLYAKGWYEQTDVVEDSKKLIFAFSGVSTEYITINQVFQFWIYTFEEATQHCKLSDADYRRVLYNVWDRFDPSSIVARLYQDERKIPELVMISAIISALSLVAVRNSNWLDKTQEVDQTPFISFGEPNPSVLPLNKSITK